MTFEPTHTINFKYLEDEGFTRRVWQGMEVRITDEKGTPNDVRICAESKSGSRILVDPSELTSL